MGFSRRDFFRLAGMAASVGGVLPFSAPRAYSQAQQWIKEKLDSPKNLLFGFNNMQNAKAGETDEYTTIANAMRLLKEHQVPDGSLLIGVGVRTGTEEDPFHLPGEMGFLFETGKPWNEWVTHPEDGAGTALGLSDPITISQMCVLDPSSAHEFHYGHEDFGKVLWSFHVDHNTVPIVNRGLHNNFSDVDGGVTETLFDAAVAAQKDPEGWANQEWKRKIGEHLTNLDDENLWDVFSRTMGFTEVEQRWIPYIQSQGWHAAAIVIEGSFTNVNQFHLKEWNQRSPNDPVFEFFKGTHGPLKIRYGREVRPTLDPASGTWTMVGYLWNPEARGTEIPIETWKEKTDTLGHNFHIHGFRSDGRKGGHTLFCQKGPGSMKVRLFPLDLSKNGFLFNNDLSFDPSTIQRDSNGLSIEVVNHGENFCRNVWIELRGFLFDREKVSIPLLSPRGRQRVHFQKDFAARPAERTLVIDPKKNFLEGQLGRSNNKLRVGSNLETHFL